MNSYEDFLLAIEELYDQNKLDFNNYKLLKKELESMENVHKQHQTEYRNYFRMLEDKIKNLVVSGGGLTENQVQNLVSNYVTSHKSELTGAQGPAGPAPSYNIWVGTQSEYDAISTKDNNTLYFIKEG